MRFTVILNSMSLARKILLFLIIVFWTGTTTINSQVTNSSLVCNSAKSCEACVRNASCFWCESQVSCKVYDVKSKDEQTKACGEWRWKSCKKEDASASLIAIISGSASAALICGEWSMLSFPLRRYMNLSWPWQGLTTFRNISKSFKNTRCLEMWSNFRVKKLVIKHEFKIGHYDRRAVLFRPIFQLIYNISITVSSDYEADVWHK